VAFYRGYLGAGIGILMIAALSLFGTGGVHRVVALKNLLTGSLRTVAVLVLAVKGAIDWGYGLPMALGGLSGGYLGGVLSGRVSRTGLRTVVIAIGSAWRRTISGTCTGRRGSGSAANEPSRISTQTSENPLQSKFREFDFQRLPVKLECALIQGASSSQKRAKMSHLVLFRPIEQISNEMDE
jgi:hypothetical protein